MDFEKLTEKVLEEAPDRWPDSLRAMRAETEVPEHVAQNIEAMIADAVAAEAGQAEPKADILPDRPARRAVPGASWTAAAALLLVAVGAGLWFFRGEFDNDQISGRLSVAAGSVQVNGRAAKVGSRLVEGTQLSTARSGTSEIHFTKPGPTLLLRALPDTKLRLARARKQIVTLNLENGRLYTQVGPRGSAQTVRVLTPTAMVQVHGTRWLTTVGNKHGDSQIYVFDGSVSARRRLADLERLPPGLLRDNSLFSGLMKTLRDSMVLVRKGESVNVTAADSTRRLAQLPRLAALLASPEISRLRQAGGGARTDPADAEAIKKASRAIAKAIPATAEADLLRRFSLAFGAPLVPRALSGARQAKLLADLTKQSFQEREQRYRALLGRATQLSETEFKRQAAHILGKTPRRVHLQDGKVLFGSVFGRGGRYHIYTARGIKVVPAHAVKRIEF